MYSVGLGVVGNNPKYLSATYKHQQAPTLLAGWSQVQKSELIVGARMGGDSWELDELEVIMQCTLSMKLLFAWFWVPGVNKLHLSACSCRHANTYVMSMHLWHVEHVLDV